MNSFLDTESVALLKAILAKNVTGQFSIFVGPIDLFG